MSIDASYQEASTCMEGSVLSFLKGEWKVSDTGSAHWASSFNEIMSFDFPFVRLFGVR
jgi:hypothetical protein